MYPYHTYIVLIHRDYLYNELANVFIFFLNNKICIIVKSFFFIYASLCHNFDSSVLHFSLNYKDDNSTLMIGEKDANVDN